MKLFISTCTYVLLFERIKILLSQGKRQKKVKNILIGIRTYRLFVILDRKIKKEL